MLILYNLLVAGKEFQRKNLHFGDIRPKNILVTTGSELKMVNVGSFPWEITSLEKVLDKFDNKTIFYFCNNILIQPHKKFNRSLRKGMEKIKFPIRKHKPGA